MIGRVLSNSFQRESGLVETDKEILKKMALELLVSMVRTRRRYALNI